VHVHAVWAVPGSFEKGLRGWYVVHRELLTPLSKQDAMAGEIIFQLYNDDMIDLRLPRSRRQHAMIDRWRSHIQGFVMNEIGSGAVVNDEGDMAVTNSGRLVKRAQQLLLQIGTAVGEMHRAGIDWEDIHPDNLMRNAGGKLCIGDIGYGVMHEDFSDIVPMLRPEAVSEYVASLAPEPSGYSASPI
jgi:hypothetical protein